MVQQHISSVLTGLCECGVRRRVLKGCLIGSAVGLLCGVSFGQQNPAAGENLKEAGALKAANVPPEGVLEGLISELDSPEWRVREDATEQLLNYSRPTLAELSIILAERKLSLEQRARLTDVARVRFMTSPRAAMGVRFFQALTSRVVVDETFSHFPAHSVLESGDMIVEIGGVAVEGTRAWQTVQSQIVSRDPGETVPVVVRRGAQRLAIEVPLGSFSQLEQPFMAYSRLARAWETRAATFLPEQMPMVPTSLVDPQADSGASGRVMVWQKRKPGDDVGNIGANGGDVVLMRARELGVLSGSGFDVGGPRVRVAGGGMARQASEMSDEAIQQIQAAQMVVFRNNNVIVADRRRGFAPIAVDPRDEFVAQEESPAQEIEKLRDLEAIIRSRLEALAQEQGKPNPLDRQGLDPMMVNGPSMTSSREQLERALKVVSRVREAIAADIADRARTPQAQVEADRP